MTETQIMQWMRDRVRQVGFTDATSLAESFLKEYHVKDAMDPEFSRSLDAGYKIAQEVRDKNRPLAG
jgi:hypothetical protein